MTEEQFNRHTAWQKKTFPTQTSKSMVIHLLKEINELTDELSNSTPSNQSIKLEFADCFLLLYGSAKEFGVAYKEIQKWIHNTLHCTEHKNENSNGTLLRSMATGLRDRLLFDHTKEYFSSFLRDQILLCFAETFKELYLLAFQSGLTEKDIHDCIEEKQIINMQRKWGTPDLDGVVKHVES